MGKHAKAILAWLRVSFWVVVPLTIYMALSGVSCPPGPPSPTAFDHNYRLIFRQAGSASPTIDGLVAGDAGWTGGFTYYFDHGGSVPVGFMEGIADSQYLYMYFEVTENSFNSEDVLVLGINPTSSDTNYRRFIIYPFVTGGAPANGSSLSPYSVEYDTATYNTTSSSYGWGSAPVPAGFTARIATATGGSNLKWSVELRIPIGAPFSIPSNNYFGLYVNVATTDAYYGTAVQYTWPPNRIIGSTDADIFSDVENTPHPDQWGNASRTTRVGSGVYITSSDIRTNNPNTAQISLSGENIFYATAHNNTATSAGLTAARSVSARFKIANFGLPGAASWTDVPTGGPGVTGTILPNPTAAADIPATGSTIYSTGPWRLNPTEVSDYTSHPHQCIRVELSSTNPSTVFVNSTAARNMNFVTTSSPFERTAKIGTKGYKLPPKSEVQEFLLTEYRYNTDFKSEWKSEIKGATPAGNLRYIVKVPQGREMDITTIITPPHIAIPSTYVDIVPDKNTSEFIKIPVKPNTLVTLIAEGSIEIGVGGGTPVPISPGGQSVGQLSRGSTKSVSTEKYLLSGQELPQTVVGAVCGSWDGFKESSFLIGESRSLKVPPGKDVLYLALNAPKSGNVTYSGKGFHIQVVQTPLEKYYTFAAPWITRDPSRSYVPIPLGANLPTWIVRGARNTGKIITIKGKKFNVYESVGAYGYIINKIGQ